MIEHIARFPRVRDRAIFVGDPADIVPDTFGPGLPSIRDWTEQHYSFAGYITGFDPTDVSDRQGLRADARLRRAASGSASSPSAAPASAGAAAPGDRQLPGGQAAGAGAADDRRGGPADRPGRAASGPTGWRSGSTCPTSTGTWRPATSPIVQGGLTTAMELTANRRPFLYFPLGHHFEQNIHVPHRLGRYRAGRRMEFDDSPPEVIAAAIAAEIGRDVDYLPVATDGAARAAELIAEML